MKSKITFLVMLMVLLVVNTSAQFTSDGLYTIQCVGTSKYMTVNSSDATDVLMSATLDAYAEFYIVENESNTGRYNIITKNNLYTLFGENGSSATLVDNTDANKNDSQALITLTDLGGSYYLDFYPNAGSYDGTKLRQFNGQKGSGTDAGVGSSGTDNYKWILTRIGDLPKPGPIVNVVQPGNDVNVLPGSLLLLQASATAEEGKTLASVEFLVDDVKVGDGVLNGELYEYLWTVPDVEGSYAISSKATSSASVVTISDAVNIHVKVLPASVLLVWPATAISVLPQKQIVLKAEALAKTGNTITKVEFFEGSNLLGEGVLKDDVYELDYYFNTLGTYNITAKVTDSGSETATTSPVEIEVSLTTSVRSLYLNFEGEYASGDWAWKTSKYEGAGLSYATYDVAKARSEANTVFEIDFSTMTNVGSENIEYQVEGFDALPNSGMIYINMNYADDNTPEAPSAGPTLWSSALHPTPGTALANDDGTFKSKAWSKSTSAMGADGSSVTIYPALRVNANNTTGKLFFDDIVMYYDPNSLGFDDSKPTAPINLAVNVVSAAEIVVSWDEGMDVGIGIDSTYVFRTTAEETTPAILDYVGYSPRGLPVGLNTVGNWTVIGVVPLGTKTFSDNTIVDGGVTKYNYAVVHKDYAYNYSLASTKSSDLITSTDKTAFVNFNCHGIQGGIRLSELTLGDDLSIYNLSGMQVYSSKVNVSLLTIDMPRGVYIVKVQGATKKVIVL